MNERIFAQVRQQFPLLQRTVNGKRLVYLDSAATSQKPVSVLDAERTFYQTLNANVHRGVHTLSVKATEAYENARATVAKFINTDTDQIVFVRNATEAINLVARTWARQNVKNGDMIVLTQAEHHSNIVPWQELAKEAGARIGYVRVDENGVLRQDDLAELLQHKPKLFAFTHVSNVLGTINPAKDMIRKAHAAGALVLLDAAQSVPHMAVDVDDLDCDFMVFSGHKMLGPMGIRVLYGRKKLLERMPPFLVGGDMIREVALEGSTWNDVPQKFEAGTPNVAGAIGLAKAIENLNNIGMKDVEAHERHLTTYALQRLAAVPGITVLGPNDPSQRLGVLPFVVEGIPAHDVASLLDDQGIAVRSGHHCAMPLHRALGIEASCRVSFYVYNTVEDVDALIDGLRHCQEVFGR